MLIAWMFALQNSTVHVLCALLIFLLASGLLEIESNARIYADPLFVRCNSRRWEWGQREVSSSVSWWSTVLTLSHEDCKRCHWLLGRCICHALQTVYRQGLQRNSISEGKSEEKERVFMRTRPVCTGQRSRHQVLIPMYF